MSMLAQLSITEAGRPDRTVAVQDTATIGRDNENDIVLETATVSRWHAVLLRDTAGVLLVDLESTNGTLINGRPVQPDEPVRLRDGDVIWLGEVVARYIAPPHGSIDRPGAQLSVQAGSTLTHTNGGSDAAHRAHAADTWGSR